MGIMRLIAKKDITSNIIEASFLMSEDRKKAIKAAIDKLEPNELLLVSGKGHENTQDCGNKIIKFKKK